MSPDRSGHQKVFSYTGLIASKDVQKCKCYHKNFAQYVVFIFKYLAKVLGEMEDHQNYVNYVLILNRIEIGIVFLLKQIV